MKKEIVEKLIENLNNTGQFKQIFKNIVPVWTNVKRFPAVAVMYEGEEKERDNLTNSKAYYVGNISVYVFNKQGRNDYEDILSDYIELVYSAVEQIRWQPMGVVDMTVSSMKREGGVVHPYAIARIDIEVRYIKRI